VKPIAPLESPDSPLRPAAHCTIRLTQRGASRAAHRRLVVDLPHMFALASTNELSAISSFHFRMAQHRYGAFVFATGVFFGRQRVACGGSEAARGDLLTDQFEWRRGVCTPLRSRGTLAALSFVYDGGAQKTLTIYWASPNRLSFLLCPQTPGDQCERSGFILAERPSRRGHGGCSERKQWA
jgi:hypothetical protein